MWKVYLAAINVAMANVSNVINVITNFVELSNEKTPLRAIGAVSPYLL